MKIKEILARNFVCFHLANLLLFLISSQLLHQIFALLLIVCTALTIWRGLMAYTNSETPVVVVLSGSMEPTFYKGDILFLNNDPSPLEVGEIIVFQIEGRPIPIVHRILEIHNSKDGEQKILTKGDNNEGFDIPLYADNEIWITRKHVLGRARALLPVIGHLTIILTEYPAVKFLLLSVMGFFVLTGQD